MGQFIDFAYVKQHANFAAVLAHYNIDVKGDGNELRCCCPFHDDGNPSMTINHNKSLFNCHAASCGKKGNILDFVANKEELDLRAAAIRLAEICKIGVAAPNSGAGKPNVAQKATKPKPEKKLKRADKKAIEAAGNAPIDITLKLDQAHSYLESRGLFPVVCKRFEMGVASQGIMKERVAVPMHNGEGEKVGYIGRYAADPVPGGTEKYRLPKGFQKNLELFNLHRIRAMATREVVLVEGVFDAIRLHELGIPTVALLGSSISDEQVALLQKAEISQVLVLLDAETDKARRKLLDRLAQHFSVRSVALPDGKDPASVSSEFLTDHPVLSEMMMDVPVC